MGAQPLPRITSDEYLRIERAAEFKSEYYQGHVYRMAGGSYRHAVIIANMTRELGFALRGGPCRVTASDVRLRISQDGLFTYPDLMVVCGERKFADDQRDTILNPTLVIEVLSPSTEGYDRGFKFAEYRKIDSLREYSMIWQTEPRVERYVRKDSGEWALSDFVGIEAACPFESVGCEVALTAIYEDVSFEEG